MARLGRRSSELFDSPRDEQRKHIGGEPPEMNCFFVGHRRESSGFLGKMREFIE